MLVCVTASHRLLVYRVVLFCVHARFARSRSSAHAHTLRSRGKSLTPCCAALRAAAAPATSAAAPRSASYARQLAAGGGDPSRVGASAPAGIVVFRRGKLPLRIGMDKEEFSQAVVWQAAAQLALSGAGYAFDDA